MIVTQIFLLQKIPDSQNSSHRELYQANDWSDNQACHCNLYALKLQKDLRVDNLAEFFPG